MAQDNANSFRRRMNTVALTVGRNVERTVRAAAMAIDSAVVTETPVDTGRARSNWIASTGSPVSYTVDAFVPGKEGSTARQNAQAAIEQAAGVTADYTLGQQIWIANNLPYIGRLNAGHSGQAPAAFVESAILAGMSVVRSSKLLRDR